MTTLGVPQVIDQPFQTVLAALRNHHHDKPKNLRAEFASDPKRFNNFSVSDSDLLFDWSKCSVDIEIMALLEKLALLVDMPGRRAAMFRGDRINVTEDRAVLHTALRNPKGKPVMLDGHDVTIDVHAVLDAMLVFTNAVRSGKAAGASGKKITDVVNIGIGGSDLGPAMATLALAPYHDGPRSHYVSNVDCAHIHDTLKGLNPETTLFIIASKTFTTVETMTNAETARHWIQATLGADAIRTHFAAVSTTIDRAVAFGIEKDRVFGFWDWVGGRYSLWSAVGLPIMIAIGHENFRDFLAGAHAMDKHFVETPLLKNIPVLMGLIGFWHRIVCNYPARAVIPYHQRLSRLPAYLQQLDMESNGKSVTLAGGGVVTPTGPLVWGEPGTNCQHAFFQLLHQGTDFIPVEFLVAAQSHEPNLQEHHELLLANCLAQSEALMKGRTLEEAQHQMLTKGMKQTEVDKIAPHRVFSGNRPSVTILYRKLDPYTLGRLIVLYEHRVFVEAQLFGINAFDQWGVELGKELGARLLPVVQGRESAARSDVSTAGLVEHIHRLRASGEQ